MTGNRDDNTRNKLLRSEIVRLGVAERARGLITELRALARVYPVVMEIVPAAAALLTSDLVITANGHGPLPGRAALPLKPKASKAGRARLAKQMRQQWAAREDHAAKEINPHTGKPYTMSKRGRLAIKRGRRAALKAAKAAEKAAKKATKKAAKHTAARPGKRAPINKATRERLATAARLRWAHAKQTGRTKLGPTAADGTPTTTSS